MTTRPDRVLAELDGLRALARSLVHGDADADDLLQDVAVATLEHPPAAEGPARPWLAAVLRNRWRMDRRSDARRRAREQASAPELEADAEVDPIERARMLQRLADALVALDEPFRATVIRRYLDGRSAAEIARELGVAAGTVRWRLKTGLERLRGELDRAAPRARWQLAIAPVGLWRASHVAKGALIVKAKIQLTAVLVLLVLAGVGAYVALHRPHRPELPAPQATLMAKVAVGVKRTPREPAPAPRPHAAPSMRPLVEPASAPGGVLAGRVLDWSTGDGIAGAELTFSADDGAVTARTGDDGSFELAPPHAGQFTLAAIAASGFLPYAPEYMHSPVRAHLAAGSAIRHVTLYLYPALDYHGLVVDAAGAPVAGAHVRLLATPDQRIDKLQSEWTSDARGTFVFHGADDAVLEATAGSKRGWARLDNAVAISKHMTIKLADVAERDAAITGRVVDGNDHPLAEVLVSADPSGPRGPSSRYGGEATSGPDGTFRIDGLDRERYDLTADSDGFAATTVPAIAGGSKGVTVVLETGLPLAGRVVAPGGDPVAAFTVTAYLRAGAAREIAATRSIADPSGHFEIRVPPGSYELIATAASWAPSPVTTAAAGTTNLELAVGQGAILRGTVTSAVDGSPVKWARVMREARDGGASTEPSNAGTVTREDGSFELTGIPAGPLAIRIGADGFNVRIEGGMTASDGDELGPLALQLTPLSGDTPAIELVGIGVALGADGDTLLVQRVIDGSGAKAAGIVTGDRITAVDGTPVTDIGLDGAIAKIRGVAGTAVAITLQRGEGQVTLQVVRSKIKA